MSLNSSSLSETIKSEALELGFSRSAICPAVEPTGYHQFLEWIDAGYAGEMDYLEDRKQAYKHPSSVLSGVKSLIMLTLNYKSASMIEPEKNQGRISKYAWGEIDYHDLIHRKLKQLKQKLLALKPDAKVRGVVDTAPILEREFAQLSGLGWIGKHTLLLNRTDGSYFFLAALLTDLELEYDPSHSKDYCGNCTACLDHCPTDAFTQPHVLDATKCISYLTIELRNPIPIELRRGMGDWLFGCDVCQDVCPWNHKAPSTAIETFNPRTSHNPIDLLPLFELDETTFREQFRKTPLWRSKRRGILRNAAILLGNNPSQIAVATLIRGLSDQETLVRGACAWALGNYQSFEEKIRDQITLALNTALKDQNDTSVQQELKSSIDRLKSSEDDL